MKHLENIERQAEGQFRIIAVIVMIGFGNLKSLKFWMYHLHWQQRLSVAENRLSGNILTSPCQEVVNIAIGHLSEAVLGQVLRGLLGKINLGDGNING